MGKYFKYAIGEILLVVIGILIALQINNWNESRKNRNKEQLYLESFKEDLLKNEQELLRIIEKSDRIKKSADSILKIKYRNNLVSNPLQLVGVSTDLVGFTIYLSNDGTVKDILGSNTLQIIKNDSLRKAIGTWESSLKSLREFEELGKNSANDFSDYLNTKFDFHVFFTLDDPRDVSESQSMSILTASEAQALFKDRLYLNKVVQRKLDSEILNEIYSSEIVRIRSFIKLLNTEIENTSHD
jgi:hypothetical protein